MQAISPKRKQNARPRVLSVVLKAHETDVQRYAAVYLPGATIRTVGRYTVVQHPSFSKIGPSGLIDLSNAHNLPLIDIVQIRAL